MYSANDENRKARGLTPEIPKSEHEYRHRITKESMKSNNLDAVLFFGTGSGGGDPIRYLAEYVHIIPRSHSLLLVSNTNDPTLVIDRPWHVSDAKNMSHIDDINTFPRGSMQLGFKEIKDTLSTLFEDSQLDGSRIGIFEQFMPSVYLNALQEVLPNAEFVSGNPVWHDLVTTPSDYGIQTMHEAAEIADEGLQTLIDNCGHGASEREACLSAMQRMASLGAEFNLSFPTTISMIGSNSDVISNLRPFVFTGNRMKNGQMFWYDQITAYKGYYMDCDRTICIGEPSDEQYKIYNTVRKMYEEMLDALSPGVSATKLWEIGLEIAAEAGYEDNVNFIHHGHTIGPSVVGESAAVPKSDFTVPADSFINIEPGIFVPDVGSACIENTIYVTESSSEPLNKTDIDMHIV
jgi:Xaa-Pro aminopeptidase